MKRLQDLKRLSCEALRLRTRRRSAPAAFSTSAASTAALSQSAAPRVSQLDMGAWTAPHPRKSSGEDAFFMSQAMRHGVAAPTATFGVADGVSAANDGGEFARRLLAAATELCRDSTAADPQELLQSAWAEVSSVSGRSTACIASVDEGARLKVVNLGDSGCRVLRRRPSARIGVVFKTKPQLWEFNCPYQLGMLDGVVLNTPADAITSEVQLLPGDVVLVATDGCFDAMHTLEILELVHRDLGANHAASEMARSLVETAIALSKDSRRSSPVMQAFEREGYVGRSRELQDDVTVVLIRVLTESKIRWWGLCVNPE